MLVEAAEALPAGDSRVLRHPGAEGQQGAGDQEVLGHLELGALCPVHQGRNGGTHRNHQLPLLRHLVRSRFRAGGKGADLSVVGAKMRQPVHQAEPQEALAALVEQPPIPRQIPDSAAAALPVRVLGGVPVPEGEPGEAGGVEPHFAGDPVPERGRAGEQSEGVLPDSGAGPSDALFLHSDGEGEGLDSGEVRGRQPRVHRQLHGVPVQHPQAADQVRPGPGDQQAEDHGESAAAGDQDVGDESGIGHQEGAPGPLQNQVQLHLLADPVSADVPPLVHRIREIATTEPAADEGRRKGTHPQGLLHRVHHHQQPGERLEHRHLIVRGTPAGRALQRKQTALEGSQGPNQAVLRQRTAKHRRHQLPPR